jgi:hypothetical protein
MHPLDALVHCEHTGFFSSHFSFRWRQVRLQQALNNCIHKDRIPFTIRFGNAYRNGSVYVGLSGVIE